MKKINYIIAAIYQRNKQLTKNDTPYFNTLMLVSLNVFFHLVQIFILLKICKIDLVKEISNSVFLILSLVLTIIIIIVFSIIFPLKTISMISIKDNDAKKYHTFLVVYSLLSIGLMMALLIWLKNKLGI